MQTWAATLKNCAITRYTYRLFDIRIFSGDWPSMSASGNSSTIGGDFLIAITSPIAMSTNPRPR